MIKGYVKNKDGDVLYKVEVPETAQKPTLLDGESFMLCADLDSIIITSKIDYQTSRGIEKIIAKKIREIAIQALVDEGQISKEDVEKLKEKI